MCMASSVLPASVHQACLFRRRVSMVFFTLPSRLELQFEEAAMGLSSSRSRLELLGCKLL